MVQPYLPITLAPIYIELDDSTYVYGNMVALFNNNIPIEPFIYNNKPESHDPNGSYVHCYPSQHKYIVRDMNGFIIRVVYTATSWSDDYTKYEIKNDAVTKFVETEHGRNRVTITIDSISGKVINVEYTGRFFGKYKSEEYRNSLIGSNEFCLSLENIL
jgi:hypothetical protein